MYPLAGYRRSSFPKAEGCGDAEDVFQLRAGVTSDYFFVLPGCAPAGGSEFCSVFWAPTVWWRLRDNDIDRAATVKKEDFTQLTLPYPGPA